MPEFTCKECGKIYKREFYYIKHLKEKHDIDCDKKDTGKNRNITDQFYTKTEVSKKCIDYLLEYLNIDKNELIIEPSAGSGSFSDYFKENNFKIESYDIEPKKEYIKKIDFFDLDVTEYINNDNKIHSVGNPPFGKQSSLAKKFIKKSALYSDTISFILPKSFRKISYQKAFPLNFHLVKELELENNSFIINGKSHNVPCVFQIWEKKDTKRYIEPKQSEKGFHFIKKPELKITLDSKENIFIEEPDFAILRAGGGKTCGRISTEYKNGIVCYPEGWLFIKLEKKYYKDKFLKEYNKINWIDDSNVGARSIDKQTFIKNINKVLESI